MNERENNQERNKQVVRRFNAEVIERGDARAFEELMAPDFVNHTAAPGMSKGAEGMWHMFEKILRPALPDIRSEVHDQLADGDRVVTRKTLHGTHEGELFGIPATHRAVAIHVIDIVRVEGGRYKEHWSVNTLGATLAELRKSDLSRTSDA